MILAPTSNTSIFDTLNIYRRVEYIRQIYTSRDISMLLRAYTTYVRPLLEYNTVLWFPSLKCDVTAVEKVQRRFTKHLPGFRNLSYAECRSKLNLTTLELR